MQPPSHRISIVDDDPSVLKALLRLLTARALTAKTYTSAQNFLLALPDGLPDCLILDLQMPEMNGLELQRHLILKEMQIPTIVITAHDEAGMRELCASAGAIAFLLKPVQDTTLLAAIEQACQRKGADPQI